MSHPFTPQDLDQLRALAIGKNLALDQLERLQRKSSSVHLLRPCTLGDGIQKLPESNLEKWEEWTVAFDRASQSGDILQFVPASGAASRMMEDLEKIWKSMESESPDELASLAATNNSSAKVVWKIWQNLDQMPCFDFMRNAPRSEPGGSLAEFRKQGLVRSFFREFLHSQEWGLSQIPKALIPFHRLAGRAVTPFEEQIREAVALSGKRGKARIHFTLAPQHETIFQKNREQILVLMAKEGLYPEVTFSFQDPSTQTLALDDQGELFRDARGALLLRPGGHGALLTNLEASGAEFAWIRNIDNIPVASQRAKGRLLRKAMVGFLIQRTSERNRILKAWHKHSEVAKAEALAWLEALGGSTEVQEDLGKALNRPLRICGFVPNTGEPGGGPFWVMEKQSQTIRIVESSEMDLQDASQKKIFQSATHFNPVELVCALRDFQGQPFRLSEFSNPEAYFTARKTQEGRGLHILEWPGLWNGSMAGWNSLGVEIPLSQFAPVKSLVDLLRPEHQGL